MSGDIFALPHVGEGGYYQLRVENKVAAKLPIMFRTDSQIKELSDPMCQ